MKKLLLSFLLIIICVFSCSCNSTKSVVLTEENLTESDYKYIDCVYNLMDKWDNTYLDSGENHYINKIAFYDFAYTGKISFYKNYPVAGYCGTGYYVNSDSIEVIDFSIYEIDNQRWCDGYYASTSAYGTDWDCSASDEEKYETIKKAYLTFLNDD